jgi:hypothetical protein
VIYTMTQTRLPLPAMPYSYAGWLRSAIGQARKREAILPWPKNRAARPPKRKRVFADHGTGIDMFATVAELRAFIQLNRQNALAEDRELHRCPHVVPARRRNPEQRMILMRLPVARDYRTVNQRLRDGFKMLGWND